MPARSRSGRRGRPRARRCSLCGIQYIVYQHIVYIGKGGLQKYRVKSFCVMKNGFCVLAPCVGYPLICAMSKPQSPLGFPMQSILSNFWASISSAHDVAKGFGSTMRGNRQSQLQCTCAGGADDDGMNTEAPLFPWRGSYAHCCSLTGCADDDCKSTEALLFT